MMRKALGVVAGAFVAFSLVAVIELVAHSALRDKPTELLVAVLFAWLSATLVGAVVACAIARGGDYWVASVVALLVFAAAAFNLAMLPHPLWFTILAVAGIPLLAGLTASTFARRRLPAAVRR